MSLDMTDNVIDSRDVIARIEELESEAEDGLDADDMRELTLLQTFAAEAAEYASDWAYGEALVRVDHFVDYAQQLAEDIGAVNSDAKWPNNHIDWAAAAEDLSQDYTTVCYDGVDFYIRSC